MGCCVAGADDELLWLLCDTSRLLEIPAATAAAAARVAYGADCYDATAAAISIAAAAGVDADNAPAAAAPTATTTAWISLCNSLDRATLKVSPISFCV